MHVRNVPQMSDYVGVTDDNVVLFPFAVARESAYAVTCRDNIVLFLENGPHGGDDIVTIGANVGPGGDE
jgi:hypothetical protein